MISFKPRVVIVTRKSPFQALVEHHGTAEQAEFYLRTRGQGIEDYRLGHQRFEAALADVIHCLPADQRRVRIDRLDLDRFLFLPDDIVVIVGQDGLVANVAKYLRGQPTIGVNPDPQRYDGVLCTHQPKELDQALKWLHMPQPQRSERYALQRRVMAQATREDGQQLTALNEVFIGHRSHQSAKYKIFAGTKSERQSSSGVICATGTGSTGWARSVALQRQLVDALPAPEERRLVWFVREPFPSVRTGTSLSFGFTENQALRLVSEMGDGGVAFADGIESDCVEFLDGQSITLSVAEQTLNLVVAKKPDFHARPDESAAVHARKLSGYAYSAGPKIQAPSAHEGELHGQNTQPTRARERRGKTKR